jgi:hypothetical protein
MNGFVLEDDASQRGTKLTWFLQSDVKGCLTSSQLTSMHIHYQTHFVNHLIKACHQIVKGQLK